MKSISTFLTILLFTIIGLSQRLQWYDFDKTTGNTAGPDDFPEIKIDEDFGPR